MGRLVILPTALEDGFATRIPAAAWRFDGGAGLRRVSHGFPMKPGQVTDANLDKVRVFLDGVEQAVAVVALRGRHPDGSHRSIGVQFRATVSFDPRAVEVWIGSVARKTVDIAWIEPTNGVPVGEDATDWPAVTHRAVVACTDAEHLCGSYVALQPLQPAAQDSAQAKAYFGVDPTDEFGEWIDWIKPQMLGPSFGAVGSTATYEMHHAMMTAYIRSGRRDLYEQMFEGFYSQMTTVNPGTPVALSSFVPGANQGEAFAKVVGADPTMPVSVDGTSGLQPEWHTQLVFGWATGYLLTGWKQPWRLLSYWISWQAGDATYAYSQWAPRFNMGLIGPMVSAAAYCVEATMQVAGGYGAGRDPNVRTFGSQFAAIMAEMLAKVYSGFGSGFADGLVAGGAQTADGDIALSGGAGIFPNFQQMVTQRFLMFYYNNVEPLAWIPGAVKGSCDYISDQYTEIGGNQISGPYWMRDHLGTPPPPPEVGEPFWAGFYTEMFGFAYAHETDPVKKAKYLTWLGYCMERSQYNTFTKTTKAFGEYWGMHQSSAYYLDGGTVRGILGAHPTTIAEPPAWSS